MKETISLDIQTHFSPTLDISGDFIASEIHAINNGRFKPILDEVVSRNDVFLPTNTTLKIDDFLSFPSLDLALPELIESDFWQEKFPELKQRTRTLNLIPSLKIPHNSLDIRKEKTIPSEQKYADLFMRKLPFFAKIKRNIRHMRMWWRRWNKQVIWGFSVIFLTIFPVVFYIKFSVETAYNILLSLPESKSFSEVREKVASAKGHFERATFLFTPFSWIPADIVDTASLATRAGEKLTQGLDSLVDIIPKNAENFSLKIVENSDNTLFRASSKDIFPGENIGIPLPTNLLSEKNPQIFEAMRLFVDAGKIYEGAKGHTKYDKIMQEVGKVINNFSGLFLGYEKNNENILTMLGHTSPQRYIIFNQNRDEIRANGGFPGSIVSFTLYKGNILDYRTDDVYYYDWNLYPHQELPPPGIALLTNNYGLRDVNYYPDFLQTLEKANNFVEKTGEATLTTAIAIHQGLIEDILSEIGPIEVEGVSEKFSAENFSLLMSILVENKFAKEKTPKDILFRFIGDFGKQAIKSKKLANISKIIFDNWQRGEVLIASRDEKTQNFLSQIQKPLPWKASYRNWIYPIFTSVSGNKSDRYIARSIEAKTKLISSCSYETTINIHFEHTFSEKNREEIEKIMNTFGLENKAEREKMQFIQGNGKNKNFVRLLVPKGAELISSGVDVSEDENATIFSFIMETPVGATTQKTISYKQNIENCSTYDGKIFVNRQPGLRDFITP